MRYSGKISSIVFLVLWSMGFIVSASQYQDLVDIKGTPRIIHYTKKDFQGDSQFWSMAQDHDGLLYFGNNDGALIFDGETWQKVSLPNNSSIRSLKVSFNGIIYAGGFNEFGIIRKDDFGKFYFESLVNLLRPEDRSFENIWQIHEAQGHMVFRSNKILIAIANGKAVTLPASGIYDFSTVLNNRLFVKDHAKLTMVDLSTMEVREVIDTRKFGGEVLLTLLPGVSSNEVLAITKQGSFYKLNVAKHEASLSQRLLPPGSDNLLTCAIRASDGNYYIGTLRSKVILLSNAGQRIETNAAFKTIQDNTVLNLFESAEGNIWVLLNNGIDCIDLATPVSLLFENAAVFDVLIRDKQLYVATNQGVMRYANLPVSGPLASDNFSIINGLEGQAWSLQFFEGKVLCSHDRGIFLVEDRVTQIPGTGGVWKIIPIQGKPHYYLACTYEGVYLMEFDLQKGFIVHHKLEGFNESSRDILQSAEEGVFWVCHGYKGVFRIKIDEHYKRVVSLEHFQDKNGLPSPFNINVASWKNQTVFTTNHGIFTYNTSTNQFEPHHFLNELFGTDKNVRQIKQVKDRTWFAHDNEVGYFYTDHAEPKLYKDFFLQLKGTFSPSMECIEPVTDKTVLLGTNNGLYAFDLGFMTSLRKNQTRIGAVHYKQDSEELQGPLQSTRENSQQFPYQVSGIRFQFSAPGFQDKLNVHYSYWLEGAEKEWSTWVPVSSKEYSLLPAGKYAFHVKSQSLLGENGAEAVYYFEILPAWYFSPLAVVLYIILALVLVFAMILLTNRRIRHEKQKTMAEEKEKRRLLELEIQRIKLLQEKEAIIKDKDQLEEDVIFKSKELVNYTMLLVKKRELLIVMHDELKELKEMVKSETGRQKLRDLIKRINLNLQNEEHIQVFEANFERVHHEFFTQLKNTYQDLSPKELQLCAFVRMNLTNKEIASILNISVRGVETARYRLRKRLGMNQEEDMGQFLEKLYSATKETVDQSQP